MRRHSVQANRSRSNVCLAGLTERNLLKTTPSSRTVIRDLSFAFNDFAEAIIAGSRAIGGEIGAMLNNRALRSTDYSIVCV